MIIAIDQIEEPDSSSDEVLSVTQDSEASGKDLESSTQLSVSLTVFEDIPVPVSKLGLTQAAESSQSNAVVHVEENLLKVLSERVATDKPPGAPILQEIVVRWTDLFKAGLPKEEKSLLLKKYGTPENCPIINPPKLNLEVKVSLQEPVTSRDSRLVDKQEKITVSLAVLGLTVSELL